jgi:hypothetical protein
LIAYRNRFKNGTLSEEEDDEGGGVVIGFLHHFLLGETLGLPLGRDPSVG